VGSRGRRGDRPEQRGARPGDVDLRGHEQGERMRASTVFGRLRPPRRPGVSATWGRHRTATASTMGPSSEPGQGGRRQAASQTGPTRDGTDRRAHLRRVQRRHRPDSPPPGSPETGSFRPPAETRCGTFTGRPAMDVGRSRRWAILMNPCTQAGRSGTGCAAEVLISVDDVALGHESKMRSNLPPSGSGPLRSSTSRSCRSRTSSWHSQRIRSRVATLASITLRPARPAGILPGWPPDRR
jgi:hypothetical protein